MKQKFPWTLPNIISLCRLAAFPVILYFIIAGNQKVFAILFVIGLFTDILDGWIARTFHMETEIGARLDSVADLGLYILALIGVFIFKWQEFKPYQVFLLVYLVLFVSMHVVPLVKFGRSSSLHLYSSKTVAYIQGGFFIVLFTLGFSDWYFFVMIFSAYIAFSECIIINILSKKSLVNAKGLYWVLANRKNPH